jgi:hypothetical protein
LTVKGPVEIDGIDSEKSGSEVGRLRALDRDDGSVHALQVDVHGVAEAYQP